MTRQNATRRSRHDAQQSRRIRVPRLSAGRKNTWWHGESALGIYSYFDQYDAYPPSNTDIELTWSEAPSPVAGLQAFRAVYARGPVITTLSFVTTNLKPGSVRGTQTRMWVDPDRDAQCRRLGEATVMTRSDDQIHVKIGTPGGALHRFQPHPLSLSRCLRVTERRSSG